MEEILETLKNFKNKKTPGTNGLNMKLFKCGSQKLLIRFSGLLETWTCTRRKEHNAIHANL